MKKLKLSVSTQSFKRKEDIIIPKLRFERSMLSASEFEEKVKEGYCFCHWFDTARDLFTPKEKRNDNFERANTVFVDVDDYNVEMKEFVKTLTHKPTLYYTTPNNLIKGYRYRLCYLFDEDIRSVDDMATVYSAIIDDIRSDVPDYPDKDRCGHTVAQYMNGNGSRNCEIYSTGMSYSFRDFGISVTENPIIGKSKQPQSVSRTLSQKEYPFTDMEFKRDYFSLSPTDLMDKYKIEYPYFESTPCDFNEEGYAVLDDDYIEIFRNWYREKNIDKNGREHTMTIRKKRRDGESRRYYMYLSALLRKKINPSITFEHLLYNLVCERLWYYDNSDHILSNDFLLEKALVVIETPVEQIQIKSKRKTPQYKIDKGYCREHGIKPIARSNQVRAMISTEKIMSVYDMNLSVKENYDSLKEQGIKVGKSKLYNLCKQFGINTNPHRNKKK